MVSDVYYEEVYYEAPSSIPYGDSKFFLCPTLLTTHKHLPIVQSGSCCGKKSKQLMWTHVFLTDCILRNDAVNSMSFFYLRKAQYIFICKSVTDQFSHQCLHKITEFNQTAKNLNCSHGSCLISDHKQLKQFSVGFVPEPPFCIIVPERTQKIIPQHWAQWPIDSN